MPTPSQTCCPDGYFYTGLTPNYPNNTCASLTSPITYTDPIDCPCCPDGYTYSQYNKLCIGQNASDVLGTIPCLPCVCQAIIPYTCSTCGTKGVPIKFQFDFFGKTCTDCTPDQSIGGPNCKQNAFMPYFINVPILQGFRLKP